MTTSNNNHWFVYILKCADNTLYTGICKHMAQRLDEHNGVIPNKGAKYTRVRRPVSVVYLEQADDRSHASKREHAIKRLSKVQKLALIKTEQLQSETNAHKTDVVLGRMI